MNVRGQRGPVFEDDDGASLATQAFPGNSTQTPRKGSSLPERGSGEDVPPGSADSFGSSSSALAQLASVATVAAAAAAQRQRYPFPNFMQNLSPPTSFNLNGSDFSFQFPFTDLRSLPTTTELLGSPTLLMQNSSAGLVDDEDPLVRLLRQEGSFGGNQVAERPASATKRPRPHTPLDNAIDARVVSDVGSEHDPAGPAIGRLPTRPLMSETKTEAPVANEAASSFLSPSPLKRIEPSPWSASDSARTCGAPEAVTAADALDSRKRFESEPAEQLQATSNDRVPDGLRAERNRQAAAASRERRRAMVNDLEARNRVLSEQNAQAQIEVLTLKREMSELIRHFKAQLERQEREKAQLMALIQKLQEDNAQLRKVDEETEKLMGLSNADAIGADAVSEKLKIKSSKPACKRQ